MCAHVHAHARHVWQARVVGQGLSVQSTSQVQQAEEEEVRAGKEAKLIQREQRGR